jgi:hypothetical protein
VSNDETFEKFKGCAVEVLQVPEDKTELEGIETIGQAYDLIVAKI